VIGAATPDNEAAKTATADCTGTKVAVGGGFLTTNVSVPAEITITASYPSDSNTWTATSVVDNPGNAGTDTSYSLTAYVICANS
jgi:hypothetical protein